MVKHQETGFTYYFTAIEALKYTAGHLRKEHFVDLLDAKETTNLNAVYFIPPVVIKPKPQEGMEEIGSGLENIDLTFTTPYNGTIVPDHAQLKGRLESFELDNLNADQKYKIEQVDGPFPVDKLGPENQILWSQEVLLYTSNLKGLGHVDCRLRVRAMKDCAFALLRSYLRLDGVFVRICDTKILFDFEGDHIYREFSVREATVAQLKEKGFEFTGELLAKELDSSDFVYPHLNLGLEIVDRIQFKNL